MTSHSSFIRMSTRRQSLLASFCGRCGQFIAASPTPTTLRSAETAHNCEAAQRNPPAPVEFRAGQMRLASWQARKQR
jgi:hypothetical protein